MNKLGKVSIVNENAVTKEDILNEAAQIWKECKKHFDQWGSTIDQNKLDSLYKSMRTSHKDFATSYPTVLRHMVQDCSFSKSAFNLYLNKVERAPWTNDKQRMDSYADYFILLIQERRKAEAKKKHTSPHSIMTETERQTMWRDYRARAQNEHDDFIAKYDQQKKELEAEELKYSDEARQDMISALRRLGPNVHMADDQIQRIITAAEKKEISSARLEQFVYDIRRIWAGDNAADVLKDRKILEDVRRKELADKYLSENQ